MTGKFSNGQQTSTVAVAFTTLIQCVAVAANDTPLQIDDTSLNLDACRTCALTKQTSSSAHSHGEPASTHTTPTILV